MARAFYQQKDETIKGDAFEYLVGSGHPKVEPFLPFCNENGAIGMPDYQPFIVKKVDTSNKV
jgi:hypothetical protein